MQKKVLVLCTGNSCRSQMAHGFLQKFAGNSTQIYSAGIETHGINNDAVAAMQRSGIDISQHTSNLMDEYRDVNFDYIITVCDHAKDNCPFFPSNALTLHQNFEDPSKMPGDDKTREANFDRIRDEIRNYCQSFVEQYL